MSNLWKKLFLSVILCVLLTAAPLHAREQSEHETTEIIQIPEITIWIDQGNEYAMRMLTAGYSAYQQKYHSDNPSWPRLNWNLIDKSYLSPEEYRSELYAALETGEGPDLICMNEYNRISPQDLMEGGYLLELDKREEFDGSHLTYLPGTLEAGMSNGKEYVLPLSVDCPVLFGQKNALVQAGIHTEQKYTTLEELLSALLKAHEKTGIAIFDDTTPLIWLREHYFPEDLQEAEKLEALLQQIEDCSLRESDYYAPAAVLESGRALISSCGIDNPMKMARNLSLMEENEISFLTCPSADGCVRGVIVSSVGINAHSKYAEYSEALLNIFQTILLLQANGNHFPAIAESPNYPFAEKTLSTLFSFQERQLNLKEYNESETLSAALTEQFLRKSYLAMEETVYLQKSGTFTASEAGQVEEKQVITVLYSDSGMGKDHPMTAWLEHAAQLYSNDTVHIQPVAAPVLQLSLCTDFTWMEAYQTSPDVVLMDQHSLNMSSIFSSKYSYADLTALIQNHTEELSFLPELFLNGVRQENQIIGLPFGISELRLYYNKELLGRAGLPQDWNPSTPDALTEDLRQIKASLGDAAAPLVLPNRAIQINQMPFLAEGSCEALLHRDTESGSWTIDRTGWTDFTSTLQGQAKEGLIMLSNSGEYSEGVACELFAQGQLTAILSDAMIEDYFSELSEEESANLSGIAFSEAAASYSFMLSRNSQQQEDAFRFCISMLQDELYQDTMEKLHLSSYRTVDDKIKMIFPLQDTRNNTGDFLKELFRKKDTDAEKLAKKYRMFEFTKED